MRLVLGPGLGILRKINSCQEPRLKDILSAYEWACFCQIQSGQFYFCLGFLFLDALPPKIAIKYPLKSFPSAGVLGCCMSVGTTEDTVFIRDYVAGVACRPSSIICCIFSSGTFNDPSEQTVYDE